MEEMPKTYSPDRHEDNISRNWEESGFFNPDVCIERGVTRKNAEPFSVLMPPPNVTGILHLGHALENSLMDTISRYKRMRGYKTLFLPGADHAAVATQARVEKNLIEKEGFRNPRQELGREELLRRIREFADNSKAIIQKQVRAMGSSCDWTRFVYTLDESREKAVNAVFKKMYGDELIYRGFRTVNWSIKGQSTCSDDELIYVERPSKLYTFKYSHDFPIPIATTRPETKLGDTAVAVHPDGKYKEYIGKKFKVSVGDNDSPIKLTIHIIGDELVDPNFGTGAVGVTPAHSHDDYEIYLKNKNIGMMQVIDENGRIILEAGEKNYVGKTVEEARAKFLEWLKNNNLLLKEEDIIQNVGTSDRFGDVVEVLPKWQWFVDVNKEISGRKKSLKDLMREAVTTGLENDPEKKVIIQPKRFVKTYLHWIDNLRDWCISRQIWYGHRIPVWYCLSCKRERVNAEVLSRWFFLRHGETDANIYGVQDGNSETPLNKNGKKQAEKAAIDFAKENIKVIISSPRTRARETAEIIGKKIGIKEIFFDDRLQERCMGKAQGLSYAETQVHFPDMKTYYGKTAQNESFAEAEERIWASVSEYLRKHNRKNVLIISHGNMLRSLWRRVHNVNPEDIMKIEGFPNAVPFSVDVCDSCKHCGGHFFEQDPDTLDTWFSSGLWTFSALGWPEQTNDLEMYHPISWIQMGYEILFFWMARMILMTSYTLKDIPFRQVYIHGILRDKDGKKFSKSLGNGIDPIDVKKQYGTDSLRTSLLFDITPGNDSRFYFEKVENERNLVNKLWNIARFILAKEDFTTDDDENNTLKEKLDSSHWIISEMRELITKVTQDMETYRFSQAGEKLRSFTWGIFADWYIEITKFEDDRRETQRILSRVFEDLLKLWHPFMPFVTETIWQEMRSRGKKNLPEFLLIAKWPSVRTYKTPPSDSFKTSHFSLVLKTIQAIRNIRSEHHIKPKQPIDIFLCVSQQAEDDRRLLERNRHLLQSLRTSVSKIEIVQESKSILKNCFAVSITSEILLYVLHHQARDRETEQRRLCKEANMLEEAIRRSEERIKNPDFQKKAPPSIIEKNKHSLKEYMEKLKEVRKNIESLL